MLEPDRDLHAAGLAAVAHRAQPELADLPDQRRVGAIKPERHELLEQHARTHVRVITEPCLANSRDRAQRSSPAAPWSGLFPARYFAIVLRSRPVCRAIADIRPAPLRQRVNLHVVLLSQHPHRLPSDRGPRRTANAGGSPRQNGAGAQLDSASPYGLGSASRARATALPRMGNSRDQLRGESRDRGHRPGRPQGDAAPPRGRTPAVPAGRRREIMERLAALRKASRGRPSRWMPTAWRYRWHPGPLDRDPERQEPPLASPDPPRSDVVQLLDAAQQQWRSSPTCAVRCREPCAASPWYESTQGFPSSWRADPPGIRVPFDEARSALRGFEPLAVVASKGAQPIGRARRDPPPLSLVAAKRQRAPDVLERKDGPRDFVGKPVRCRLPWARGSLPRA